MEMINDILLDLSHYSGEDSYSDGDIEERILESCKNDNADLLLKNSSNYAVFYHLSELRHNLIEWFPFSGNEEVLEVGSGCGAMTGVFAKKAKNVVCVDLSKRRSMINAYRNKNFSNIKIIVGNFQEIEKNLGKFDIITLIGVLEYSPSYIECENNPFVELLSMLRKHLRKDGRILIAIENKMGIKYFNGAWEDHLMRQYDGINDYLTTEIVRTFSKQELVELFTRSGYNQIHFYFPSPDYKLPDVVYSDKYLPKPSEIRTFGKNYQGAQFYNFYDMVINDQICNDGMFDYFSNSFLAVLGDDISVKYSKFSRERLPEYRIGTLIRGEAKTEVLKFALSDNAREHIFNIKRNEDKISEFYSKINSRLYCSKGKITEEGYISEFVDGVTLQQDFYKLRHDLNGFTELAKRYIKDYFECPVEYMQPFVSTREFERVFGDVTFETLSMEVTNVDSIFSNLIRNSDGDVYLIDYEWVFDFPIPFEYPIWRAVSILYAQYSAYLNRKTNLVEFVHSFGLDSDKINCFRSMDNMFSYYVCGNKNTEVVSKAYEKESLMQINRRF